MLNFEGSNPTGRFRAGKRVANILQVEINKTKDKAGTTADAIDWKVEVYMPCPAL